MEHIDFQKNNLDKAHSPYLRQHSRNPIYWQEWNPKILDYAKEKKKLIFVSIGYATCHWCHVMAKETFSENNIAKILNKYFVSIKVDREERPDIDHYFMDFIIKKSGHGGWPLNAFLSPEQKPILGGTYFPPHTHDGLTGFIDVLHQVLEWFKTHKYIIEGIAEVNNQPSIYHQESQLEEVIAHNYDIDWGGYGRQFKFPPHSTLLFLMAYYEEKKDIRLKTMVTHTLDVMALRGLHDHLQGGFFRYTADRAWTMPHFEKMLYDQAMHLWTYSSAYKLFGKLDYKTIAEKIIQCLREGFLRSGLFYTALDADTDQEEGKTYLWSKNELEFLLNKKELAEFASVYEMRSEDFFSQKNHLLKKKNIFIPHIEAKLLEARNKRPQPSTDKKIITSWNALVGTALIMAYRILGSSEALQMAKGLLDKLLERNVRHDRIIHSSIGDLLQNEGFLEDYASLLLLVTYVYEEIGEYRTLMVKLLGWLADFYGREEWYMNPKVQDFSLVKADFFDQPIPSPASLAEFAQYRAQLLLGETTSSVSLRYKDPLRSDFYNLFVFLQRGNYHEIHSPEKIDWKLLPLSSIQIKGNTYQHCHKRKCQQFSTLSELLNNIGRRA